MARLLILVTLLVGCVGAPRSPAATQAARESMTAAALLVWERRFEPVPQCWAVAGSINWVEFEGEAYFAACKSRYSHACTIIHRTGGTSIVLRKDSAHAHDPFVWGHELTHWLQHCSGRRPDGDPGHEDQQVWPSVAEDALRIPL